MTLLIYILIVLVIGFSEIKSNEYFVNTNELEKEQIDECNYYLTLGISNYKNEKYDEAIEYFKLILSIDSSNTKALSNIGHVYRELGNITESLEYFLKAYNISPNEINYNYNLAVSYHSLNDYTNALRYYQQTLSLDSGHVNANYNLGLLYQDTENFELSMNYYMTVLRTNPYHVDSRLNYCNILFTIYSKKIDSKVIEKCYQDVIMIDYYYVRGLLNIGSFYQSKSKSIEVGDKISLMPLILLETPIQLSDHSIEYYLSDLFYNYTDNNSYDPLLLALSYYYIAVILEPSNSIAQHAIKSLSNHPVITNLSIDLSKVSSFQNDNDDIIYNNYIVELFDSYAYHFDESLLNQLNYTSHILIANMISSYVNSLNVSYENINILDVGAGTGLLCNPLKKVFSNSNTSVINIIGIDLSSKMLDKANKKECYNSTYVREMNEFLLSSFEEYNIIVAADVFVYAGNLSTIFMNSYEKLSKNGLLGFTVELLGDSINLGNQPDASLPNQGNILQNNQIASYKLMHTGRYAHTYKYIYDLAIEHSFMIIHMDNAVLRHNQGEAVIGLLVLLSKI